MSARERGPIHRLLSFELQALAVSDSCVRVSFICASVNIPAVFKALSMASISSRWERRIVNSSLHSPVVTLPIFRRRLLSLLIVERLIER
jgi:hypothetical protein